MYTTSHMDRRITVELQTLKVSINTCNLQASVEYQSKQLHLFKRKQESRSSRNFSADEVLLHTFHKTGS
jgi:hypothetical protein